MEKKIEKFTHPVELTDEELDLVAAGWGELVSVDVTVKDNNIAVLSQNFSQS
jgi:hypothetical protein